jgi:cyclopropane-fatty-acyl-phospholipid synthase
MIDSTSPRIASPSAKQLNWLDAIARRAVRSKLRSLQRGTLYVDDGCSVGRHGRSAELRAYIEVRQPRFYRAAALGGSLAVAESYLRGDWECEQLVDVFRIMVRNRAVAGGLERGLARLQAHVQRLTHWWRANTRRGSRRNISAHYDLGNEFYQLWLDDTLAYSSGIFPTARATLGEASTEKFDRICRKLELRASDEVVEIGSGWGGFALHAAANYGCRVTTTTISQQQFETARQRIDAARLGDRITLVNHDYRDLAGKFDKLVSIEMIEAVGFRYFDDYFRKVGELLRPQGTALLQAIVMPERHYDQYLRGVDFIQRYVFPGGCLPSLGAMLDSAGRASDMRLVHVEDFAPHYAETLRRWRQRFEESLPEVRRLGYDERFIRLWRYYLCYCEAAFEERAIGVAQLQFDQPECRRDPLRITGQAAGGLHTLEPLHQ